MNENVALFVMSLLAAIALNLVAKQLGFYKFPLRRTSSIHPFLPFKSVVIVFGIYWSIGMLLGTLVHAWYRMRKMLPPSSSMHILQIVLVGSVCMLLCLYFRSLSPALRRYIIKPSSSSIAQDCLIGAATWIVSFPIVAVIGQIADVLVHILTGFETYEQVAVRYLKNTLHSPSFLVVALILILIIAPAIEELLFRGFLQTYLKQKMARKWAILCSSIAFACLHFSSAQGLGNISLLISLFTFALFLGFIYERQASLFASFSLHVTFNTISTVRILFFSDHG